MIFCNDFSSFTSDSKIVTLANGEDPDEILCHAVFHQGLHYFLIAYKNDLQRKKYNFYLKIVTYDPWRYTVYHSRSEGSSIST